MIRSFRADVFAHLPIAPATETPKAASFPARPQSYIAAVLIEDRNARVATQFYERLSATSDEELERHGLKRRQIADAARSRLARP